VATRAAREGIEARAAVLGRMGTEGITAREREGIAMMGVVS